MKTSNKQTQNHSAKKLKQENQRFANTGGISENNHDKGFVPAFLDVNTGKVYRSRFANGMPAPIHILAGIPSSILGSIISGFLLNKIFYTREEAAATLKKLH